MIKKVLQLLLLPALAFAVQSCDGKGGGGTDKVPEPYIQSITTDYDGKAVAGMPVTLNGINFSPVASENKVLYGVGLDAVALIVRESSAEHVMFTAPTVDKDKLKIRVSVNGKESNSVELVYTTIPDDKPGGDDNPPEVPEEPWDDTPTLVLEGATTVKICEGVEWTSFHGPWEGQIRNINIIRTKLDEHNKLGIYFNYAHNGLDNLDEKCEYLDAVAGTNGPMACCQFVRVDGVVRHAATEADYWICNCAITIDGDAVDIVKVKDNYKANRLTNDPGGDLNPPENTLTVGCAGPLLVWDGKIQEYPEDNTQDFLRTPHPRTAIGLSSDCKTVIQVAVDGRWTDGSTEKRAIGMSTPLLAKLMRGLGCYKAMNFDGGGGTAMWVYGQGDHGIVNHPCDKRDWEHAWESLRATGNAVYIKSDLKK